MYIRLTNFSNFDLWQMQYSGSWLSEIQTPHPQPPPPSGDASGTPSVNTSRLRWETRLQRWFTASDEGTMMYLIQVHTAIRVPCYRF